MKTQLILISAFFIMLTTQAQQLIAYTYVSMAENHKNIVATKRMNASYLNAVNFSSSTMTINQLQREAANYNIKSSSAFDDSEPAIYDVNFKKGKNRLWVTYDHQGHVLSSHETYFNVPLPVDLRIEISKRYPDWEFVETKCQINYDFMKGSQKTYHLTLKKGSKKIILNDLVI